jgi:hypothetical protein
MTLAGASEPRHAFRVVRPLPDAGLLILTGRTTEYSFDPIDEYVVGLVERTAMVATRSRQRFTVEPGQVCGWGPGHAHRDRSLDGRAWAAVPPSRV